MNEISAAETPKLQAQLSELTSKLPKKTINESLVTLQKAVQEKTAHYDIHKNEELLESFQLYHTFLENLTPKGQTPEDFFNLIPEIN